MYETKSHKQKGTKGISKVLWYVLTICCFMQAHSIYAQDVPYSQFFSTGIHLNPALAGANLCPRFKLVHREQWPSIPSSFSTTHIMVDWHSLVTNAGWGFSYKNDSHGEGILQTHSVRGAFAKPVIFTSSWMMHAGIYGSFNIRQLNWNKLQFADQLDTNLGFVNPTMVAQPEHTRLQFPDFGAGISMSFRQNLYIGMAVNHLFRPHLNYYENADIRLDRKYSGHLAFVVTLEDKWPEAEWERNASLTPNIIFEKQGYFYHLTAGMYFSKQPVLAGVWLRHALENMDAVIFNVGFQQPRYRVGYSFDLTISPLTVQSSGGSHELSFTWYLDCPKPPARKHEPLPCPPSIMK